MTNYKPTIRIREESSGRHVITVGMRVIGHVLAKENGGWWSRFLPIGSYSVALPNLAPSLHLAARKVLLSYREELRAEVAKWKRSSSAREGWYLP